MVSNDIKDIEIYLDTIMRRIQRLLGDYPEEEKKYEIVPTLAFCEIILGKFDYKKSLFFQFALQFTTVILSFGELYSNIIVLINALFPSYSSQNEKQKDQLFKVLQMYFLQITK